MRGKASVILAESQYFVQNGAVGVCLQNAFMYLCECVYQLVFCVGALSYDKYQFRVGVFFPTLVYEHCFCP